MAKKAGARTILNPARASDLTAFNLAAVDFLTPNETEAKLCLGLDPAQLVCMFHVNLPAKFIYAYPHRSLRN